MIDLTAATEFLITHGRLIDRHRLHLLVERDDGERALAALAAYRNPDGGFGWGIEPDLRASASQPVGALHALEVLEEIAPATDPMAAGLCDWLGSVTLPDGGLPFALPGAAGPGTAPWWAGADPTTSSLHITSAVCAQAHRVATHDDAVATHPWLRTATDHCLRAVAAMEEPGGSYELRYVLDLLDAVAGAVPEATDHLERLAGSLPPSWERPVEGGLEGEKLRPLDFSPRPDGPLRRLAPAGAIERDLERVAGGQQDDGGWVVDFASSSPAGALEWRGYATVGAIGLLAANGRLAEGDREDGGDAPRW